VTLDRSSTLVAPLREATWVLLPDLQGRHTNLSVGISFHDGRMTALAQWSSTYTPGIARFCLATDRDGVARVLTFARVAVVAGRA
jgi:hypothetical protein